MRRSISSARTLEMHVDGFRFDLASALARELHAVDRLSRFFDLIHQNPAMNRVKLIAEPWDVGEGGYQVGNFPPLWSEWNGKYRDTIRDFVRGADQTLAEFASRFAIRWQADIGWFKPDGTEMTEGDWGQSFAKSLGVFLNGQAIAHPDARGERVVDASFYALFNAHHEPLAFTLPTRDWGDRWVTVLDTSAPLPEETDRLVKAGEQVQVRDRSVMLLRRAD